MAWLEAWLKLFVRWVGRHETYFGWVKIFKMIGGRYCGRYEEGLVGGDCNTPHVEQQLGDLLAGEVLDNLFLALPKPGRCSNRVLEGDRDAEEGGCAVR